ncbi:alpha/beta hydrolase [Methylocapsa sp. S129]|uniref:alpha/beta hydrolase n=1 Tax=Methylocapsa sp. S129 TaxID=1641869 RepID=UPI00131B1757|nr:alpha/beta hydrolase [Methylocapsa sp. S129]
MTFILLACVVLYIVALAAIALGQRKLLYFPNASEVAPAAVGLPNAQALHLQTDDGETLLAWYVAPAAGKPLILYFHGNADGLAARNERFKRLTASGNGLLAVEYRGYAGSTGAPSEQGLLRDGEATYAKALALGVPAGRIVAMGESLGTGVAIDLAARHKIGALVLDSPYSSIVDVAAAKFWMFPVRLLMVDTFRSDDKIGQVAAPALMVHGTADATIPIRFAERLFALAREPKDFIRVDGAGHLALGSVIPQVVQWIDQAMARAAP